MPLFGVIEAPVAVARLGSVGVSRQLTHVRRVSCQPPLRLLRNSAAQPSTLAAAAKFSGRKFSPLSGWSPRASGPFPALGEMRLASRGALARSPFCSASQPPCMLLPCSVRPCNSVSQRPVSLPPLLPLPPQPRQPPVSLACQRQSLGARPSSSHLPPLHSHATRPCQLLTASSAARHQHHPASLSANQPVSVSQSPPRWRMAPLMRRIRPSHTASQPVPVCLQARLSTPASPSSALGLSLAACFTTALCQLPLSPTRCLGSLHRLRRCEDFQ